MFVKLQKRWILVTSMIVYLVLIFSWTRNYGFMSRKYSDFSQVSLKDGGLLTLKDMLASDRLDNSTKLKLIAEYVKQTLDKIQSKSDCDTVLLCGHEDNCGLGCQLHHRSLCLAFSLVLNLPLVHTGLRNWPYNEEWNSVFKPLGSSCSLEQSKIRYVVDWWKPCDNGSLIRIEKYTTDTDEATDVRNFEFTLAKGLPMPGLLADALKWIHSDPTTWVVGMFLNLSMELNGKFEKEMRILTRRFRAENIVGAHIRRTDKVSEAPGSVHNVSEYADKALEFHQKFSNDPNSVVTVYVATDDPKVVEEFRSNYKASLQGARWRIWSLANEELPEGATVNNNFKSIVKDVLMLAKSDFIICGFSSNVCRLIWELKTFQGDLNLKDRFHSLDGGYEIILLCNSLPSKIVKYLRSTNKE